MRTTIHLSTLPAMVCDGPRPITEGVTLARVGLPIWTVVNDNVRERRCPNDLLINQTLLRS
jgi:hypothetical protein